MKSLPGIQDRQGGAYLCFVELTTRLDTWFALRLTSLRCSADTKAYVTGVLSRFRTAEDDLSNVSIVLAWRDASMKGDFAQFQRIGDWVLWVDALCPEHISQNREVVETIGRQSFYSCHRIMKGQWRVFEELADELPKIAVGVRKLVQISHTL